MRHDFLLSGILIYVFLRLVLMDGSLLGCFVMQCLGIQPVHIAVKTSNPSTLSSDLIHGNQMVDFKSFKESLWTYSADGFLYFNNPISSAWTRTSLYVISIINSLQCLLWLKSKCFLHKFVSTAWDHMLSPKWEWDFSFSRCCVWRWQSSGILRYVK